jgi:hypothetical protein
MIEHSCCCIWDFVMSALNQIQFGFENSLKFGFEKLEKEKGKEFLFFSGRFLLPQPTPRPASPRAAHLSGGPFLSLPRQRPPPVSLGRAQAAASRPVIARGLPPHPSR